MSWFSRARPSPDPVPDPHLPMLSVDDAEWLRDAAVRALTAAGVPGPRAAGDHLVDADAKVYGLGNLAAMIARVPRRARDHVVQDHVRGLLAARARQGPESLAEIADIVIARVVADDAPGDGPDLAPGLALRACVDYPETVATLFDLAGLGGWETVGPVAMGNLARLPLPEHEAVKARGGGTIHLLSSQDMFGASRLLDLDALFGSVLRIAPPPRGALVAVPHRHLLAVHVLEDESVVPALNVLAGLAHAGVDAAGPVSAEVYFRSVDGQLQQVTTTGADGSVAVRVDGAFAVAMGALGLMA